MNAVILSAVSFCMVLFSAANGFSQDVTSPYSILGIGDIDTKEYGRFFSSGGTSIARRSMYGYNFSNPASLTSLPLKTMNYDFNFKGTRATYTYPEADTATGITSNDVSIKRLALAFRSNEKTAFAAGLKPYSSVNYMYQLENAIFDGNSSYVKLIEGSGGINQFYVSYAKAVHRNISVGVTASWLFGSIQRSTEYYSESLYLDITKKETDFYNAAQLQGGFQYYSSPKRKWVHQIGVTGTVSTHLKGEYVKEYFEGSSSVDKEVQTGKKFELPFSVGIGYAAIKNDNLTLSIDAQYSHWTRQKVNYASSYTGPAIKASAGIEYSFKQQFNNALIEKTYLSAGLSFENNYVRIRNNYLSEYALYIGGGTMVSRSILFNAGLSFGTKGNKALGQIRENTMQYTIGFTLRDIWLGPKYTRRYD